MRKILLLAFAVMIVAACEQGRGQAGKNALVKIDGVVITAEEVKKEFEMLPPQVKVYFMDDGGMRSLVEELVKKELLYKEAKKRGMGGDADFQKKMEDYRKRLMVEKLLEEEIEKKAVVEDRDVREFYDKNKTEFVMREPGKKGKGKPVEFEHIRDLIRQRLVAEKQKELFDVYIASLKKTYHVETNEEAIKNAFGNAAAPALKEGPDKAP